jgi:hypothetical protein
MKHYDFPTHFRDLFDQAVAQYRRGQRGAATYFTPQERAWLSANGLSAQNLYDYAEDEVGGNEPGFAHALLIETARRKYFLIQQGGKPSGVVLDPDALPAKTDAVKGVEWLPRLIPKAKAKLKGELPDSLMYCCGGDRRFFKAHDILPVEFLALVWQNGDNDAATVDWVLARIASGKKK